MKFSIISPIYKGQKYIENLIGMAERNHDLLIKNGYDAQVELILVNDYPKDNLVCRDSKKISINLIEQEENVGIHHTRIRGLQASKGEYILFLDQDDLINDNYLLNQYQALSGADLVICNAYMEDEKGRKKQLYRSKKSMDLILNKEAYILGHNRIVSPGQALIRARSIPDIWKREILAANGSDDLFLWLLLFNAQAIYVLNPSSLYTHKYSGNNLSLDADKMAKSSLSFANVLEKYVVLEAGQIEDFKRSRCFDIRLRKSCNFEKVILLIKNIDIVIKRIKWKLG